ncbi:MAG: ribosome maturation factor RimP [Lachnospiraceae bacterium]|nr:ribosome maturation factor RimP [Lachnospiraceae bacterium]
MAGKREYEARTEALLEPIAAGYQVEIYDVEYVKEGREWYLRAYIDKTGGVTIEDCEKVSRALSDALDLEDFIPDAYILEVSSPGLGRQLKKDRHFDKSLHEKVEVKMFEAVEGVKELEGILQAYDQRKIVIMLENEREIELERNKIAQVRLKIDF